MIKVLFVTASTTGGGAEKMLFNIIRSLDENHQVRLFITSDEKIPDIYKDNVISYNANKSHAIESLPKLLKYIKEYKPAHVFTTSSNIGYLLIIAKKILRQNFKIYIRCAVPPSEIYQKDLKTRLLNRIIRRTYNAADLIIAQTDFSRDDLIKAYNLSPNKVKTIRNIVDIDMIKTLASKKIPIEMKSEDFNIVASGALYSVKGFDILIKAIAPLIKGSDKHLYILGEERYEEGYRDYLQGLINKANAPDNIHLIGHKSNPYPYYQHADLFVMSSRKEGFPNVVLESLTLGTPVVATNCVDWNGVINEGENGFIVAKNDIQALNEGLSKAFFDEFECRTNSLSNFNYNELFI